MKIVNKRAHFDYELLETFEAGINLQGQEVKAVREGHADLTGSYARIIGSEAYLINAKIFPYEYARTQDYDQNRTRKLLLHKQQIISLKHKTHGASLTIVPVSMYTTRNLIKVELAIGKSRKEFDKREQKKRKDLKREMAAHLKSR
ncbi:MAG: SsrA-binding protein SmpB [Patescibacteria group bacterium]